MKLGQLLASIHRTKGCHLTTSRHSQRSLKTLKVSQEQRGANLHAKSSSQPERGKREHQRNPNNLGLTLEDSWTFPQPRLDPESVSAMLWPCECPLAPTCTARRFFGCRASFGVASNSPSFRALSRRDGVKWRVRSGGFVEAPMQLSSGGHKLSEFQLQVERKSDSLARMHTRASRSLWVSSCCLCAASGLQ